MASHGRETQQTALGALLLVVAGTGCGLAFNSLRPAGLRFNASGPLCKPTQPQAKYTTLEEARAALEDGTALFVDTRSAEDYAEGHIPGAISFPYVDFDDALPKVRPQLEAAQRIITYCSGGECRASEFAGDRLVGLGLKGVEILPDGFGAWQEAGYPVTVGDEP